MNLVQRMALASTSDGRKRLKDIQAMQNFLRDGNNDHLKDRTPELLRVSKNLTSKSILNWRDAQRAALQAERPSRVELYSVYDDTMLDDHVSSTWQLRVELLLKSRFIMINDDESENDEAVEWLKRSWFLEALTLGLESKLWGHSLIQFTVATVTDLGREFCQVDLVPREHVKPEIGEVVKQATDERGWSYKEGGPFYDWTIEAGKTRDLGILLKASPLAISKKFQGQFWDQFSEVFSVPIRLGKTDTSNKKERNRLKTMLEDMGRASWGVFSKDTDLEIIESKQTDAYRVYDKRIDRCDKGNSKLILGATMITDDGSSKSQSDNHMEVAKIIAEADKRFITFWMNETVIPFLISHGYPFEGTSFKFDETRELTHKEQLEVDKWLIQFFEVEIDYYKKRYNANITDFRDEPLIVPGGTNEGK